eukprot:scaffold8621_cov13-Prasinocladus_malaysianus.AAC.1
MNKSSGISTGYRVANVISVQSWFGGRRPEAASSRAKCGKCLSGKLQTSNKPVALHTAILVLVWNMGHDYWYEYE